MDMQSLQAWNALTAQDQALFREHVASAMGRHGKFFIRARRAMWTDWLLTGSLGLLGIFVLGWSSTSAAVLLLAGFWLGWVADLALRILRSDALVISYQHAGGDLWFWQTVAILRGKRRQAANAPQCPSLGFSLIVDLVAGAAVTLLAVNGLADSDTKLGPALRSPSVILSIVSVAVFGVAPALWIRMQRAPDGSIQLPVFAVGQRGIGLLVFVFALMGLGGGQLLASILMAVTYGFFVIMATIEFVWGIPELIREREWVEKQRADHLHSTHARPNTRVSR
ncbi:MAG: hypothetical protein WBV39_15860 [Rudaea sp.]